MTDGEWDLVHEVHVKGAYACSKAAWGPMRKQKFGRIINVSHSFALAEPGAFDNNANLGLA